MTAPTFTALFLAAVALTLAVELALAFRHIAAVRRHRDAVPAAFAGRIGLPAHRKAADYTVAHTRLAMLASIAGTLLLIGLTRGRGVAFLTGITGIVDAPPLVQDLLLIVAVVLLSALVSLPFAAYRTFVIEARYGFNRTTFATWLADLAKGTLVGSLLGLPIAALVIALMRWAGGTWWLWAWAAWMAFQLVLLALYPTVIAPLFNRFTPMPEGPARARIEALLARCGFASRGLYLMDGSKRSSHGNAYFTGFGRAKRIVMFDTLLERLTPDETEAVLAHELGHFKLRHVAKRIAWSAAASLGFFALLAWLATSDWFYQGLFVPPTPERPGVALVLFFLVLPVFTFLLAPIASWYSRRHEYEADAFAARHASAGAMVSALVRLYEDNAATLTPDPIHSAFHDSHPPAALRIAHLEALAGAAPRSTIAAASA
ncbi:MAG TPA: M48 family metallopeptidase [Casimicrobiaceae bacterium]|jgi:STE24 endopeptidase|nr:M48 family metallopeptidase [Casimicrobiaceae bacterium]